MPHAGWQAFVSLGSGDEIAVGSSSRAEEKSLQIPIGVQTLVFRVDDREHRVSVDNTAELQRLTFRFEE